VDGQRQLARRADPQDVLQAFLQGIPVLPAQPAGDLGTQLPDHREVTGFPADIQGLRPRAQQPPGGAGQHPG
jgi:hypothetical protein